IGIVAGEREDRDTVERAAGGDNAGGADEAAGGFQADDVVESGGDSAGAGGVGAEGEAHQSRGDSHSGTRAGASGNVIGVESVAAGAVGRTDSDQAGGK